VHDEARVIEYIPGDVKPWCRCRLAAAIRHRYRLKILYSSNWSGTVSLKKVSPCLGHPDYLGHLSTLPPKPDLCPFGNKSVQFNSVRIWLLAWNDPLPCHFDGLTVLLFPEFDSLSAPNSFGLFGRELPGVGVCTSKLYKTRRNLVLVLILGGPLFPVA
jgi:hypothetical protein